MHCSQKIHYSMYERHEFHEYFLNTCVMSGQVFIGRKSGQLKFDVGDQN